MPQFVAARARRRSSARNGPVGASPRAKGTLPYALLSDVSGLQCVYLPTYTWTVAQVTVYLADDVLAAARTCAENERRSLSAWVSARIREATLTEWPANLVELLRHGGGDIVEPDDPPPGDLNLFP